MARTSFLQASRPPAEAPIPTTRKPADLRGATTAAEGCSRGGGLAFFRCGTRLPGILYSFLDQSCIERAIWRCENFGAALPGPIFRCHSAAGITPTWRNAAI